jgi:hypothetical protein
VRSIPTAYPLCRDCSSHRFRSKIVTKSL